jgi:hypothetical protein
VDEWGDLYSEATLGQISETLAALDSALDAATRDYYEAAFESGNFETSVPQMNPDGSYPLPNSPDLCAIRLSPDGQMRIVRLPKEGFEAAYALRDEMAWLMHRRRELTK